MGKLAVVICTASLLACGEGVLGPDGIVTLEVHPSRVTCEGEGVMQCLQVRELNGSDWSPLYEGIEGFHHEPGVLQKRVRLRTPQLTLRRLGARKVTYAESDAYSDGTVTAFHYTGVLQ